MVEVTCKVTNKLERCATSIAKGSGTTASLVIHTIIIVGVLSLYFVGVELNTVLLILTTMLSIEAIYLSIFIQFLQNRVIEQSPDIEV